MATKQIDPFSNTPRLTRRVGQLKLACEKGRNTNVDLAPGRQAYYVDRLIVLINPDVVRRPDAERPIGVPPDIMKAFVAMKQLFGLRRVESVVESEFRCFVPPAKSVARGLSPEERAVLHGLVMPVRPGELPAFREGVIPLEEAIEMASRLELVFRSPARVQDAAQFLCGVANIQRVERPVCAYTVSSRPQNPPPPPPPPKKGDPPKTSSTAPNYAPDWWRTMTRWNLPDLTLQPGTISKSGLVLETFPDIALNNIAVLDSGTDLTGHPVLTGVADTKPSGFPYLPDDTYGHGSHVISIIAGRDNNGFVVTSAGETMEMPGGALPNSTVLNFRIFDNDDPGSVDMKKLRKALSSVRVNNKQVKVINLSIWMLDVPDWDLRDRFQQLENAGVVVCACVGNRFEDQPPPVESLPINSAYRVLYPARLAGILAVGSVDKDSERSAFSRFSTRGDRGFNGNDYNALTEGHFPMVDLLAPGEVIWGATIKNYHDGMKSEKGDNFAYDADGRVVALMRGTSMATPLVTAAAAYLCHYMPSASASRIRYWLRQCVDPTDINWTHQKTAQVQFDVDVKEMHGAGVLDFRQVIRCAESNET